MLKVYRDAKRKQKPDYFPFSQIYLHTICVLSQQLGAPFVLQEGDLLPVCATVFKWL